MTPRGNGLANCCNGTRGIRAPSVFQAVDFRKSRRGDWKIEEMDLRGVVRKWEFEESGTEGGEVGDREIEKLES